ncbi:MAG: hypothetical protein HY261_02635 [Chloroflexi bacterium]|nr:hypothetical protein [Chloroflexota bacterium]
MPVVRVSEEHFKKVQEFAEPLVDSFDAALGKVLSELDAAKEANRQKPKRGSVAELAEMVKAMGLRTESESVAMIRADRDAR